jgi:hypothetical protein
MKKTVREIFEELIKGNPRFREVAPTGEAVVIVGAHPVVGAAVAPDDAPTAPAKPQTENTSEA